METNDNFLVDLMIGETGLIGGDFDTFYHPQNIASSNGIEYDGIGIMQGKKDITMRFFISIGITQIESFFC